MIEVPRAFRGRASAARALRFSALAFITAAAWAAFALQHLVLEYFRIATVDAVACVAILAIREWVVRLGDDDWLERGGHFIVGICAVALGGASLLSGQEHAMATWFLCVLPLFAGFHMGVRAALGWSAVAALVLTAVHFSRHLVEPRPEYLPDVTNFYMGKLVLLLIVLGLTVATRRAMNHFIAEVNEQKSVIRQRATELAIARDEALEAVRVKDEFLANMSHEIRTPLNGIIGMTSVMLESELPAPQREVVTTIQRSSNTLLAVINEILDFSRLEAGARVPESIPLDLRECIEDVVDMFARDAWTKSIDLAAIPHPNTPRWVEGDITYLRQVLINLVGNAVKFTDEGAVVVRVRPGTEEGSIVISVMDTGIGIPPDKREVLFEAFTQGDSSTTRRYGGTGLGLAISKKLVEIMGGTIGVESTSTEGTTFRVDLDLPEVRPPARPVTTHERISLIGRRVAIVGGSSASREALEAMLASWGVRLTPKTAEPPIIVTFGEIEPGDLEFADIIALVPLANPEAERRALEAGAHFVVYWPARRRSLREAIEASITGGAVSKDASVGVLDTTMGTRIPANILIAEDNPVNQKVVQTILEKLGYTPETVADGAEVVASVAATDYDILLMDLQMPELDGFEATRRIRRELPEERQPWIVALTATVGPAERKRAMEAGMDDFLGKPFDLQSLMAVIERYADSHAPSVGAEPPGADPWQELREMFAARPDKLVELIKFHLENGRTVLDALQAAASTDDFAAIKLEAHKLKSTSAQFGSRNVAKIAWALEEAASEGDGGEVKRLLSQLATAWKTAEGRLDAEVEQLDPASA